MTVQNIFSFRKHFIRLATASTLIVLSLLTAIPAIAQNQPVAEQATGEEELRRATELNQQGLALYRSGNNQRAVVLLEQALQIRERLLPAYHLDVGNSLNSLAGIYKILSLYSKSEPLYLRSLAISEKIQGVGHPNTGIRLNNLASLYESLGQYAKAEPMYLRALAIAEKTQGPEHPSTSARLSNLAGLYESLGQYAKAMQMYMRALSISEKVNGADHTDTGTHLNNLAVTHQYLAQYANAEPLYLRALAISEKAQGAEHPSTGTSLNNLANLYQALGQYAKAEPLYLRALAISEKAQGPEHPETGTSLNNLAGLYRALGQYAKAVPLYLRAISINEKSLGGQHPSTGAGWNNLAALYQDRGQYAKAGAGFIRALQIAESAKTLDLIWKTSGSLMALYAYDMALGNFPRNAPLAIWYGKQSVNTLQSIRENIRSLDKESQQSFLKQNQSTYEYLANLLIEENRLAEAEQVLDMLKDYELQELTRSSTDQPAATSASTPVKQVDYSGAEIALTREFEALSKASSATYTEHQALKTRQSQGETLGAADLARLAQLETAAETHRKAFDAFMARLQTALAPSAKSASTPSTPIRGGAPKMEALLRNVGSGHVGLQYVVTEDRLSILFSSTEGTFARQINLDKDQLKNLVLRLQSQLKTPHIDPRPVSLALHKLLIEPIAPELAAAKAHTLVLNLTDFLRYIPFAALYDGKNYLIEQYGLALYTPASNQTIAAFDARAWQVAGLGATQSVKFEDDNASFKALLAVRNELTSIVRTGSTPGGALPGQILLDPDFTRASFTSALSRFPVMHVASHYQFAPNSEHRSYLVLGDGSRMSLAELNRLDFTNVQLLALSACDTATGGGRNEKGSEIEGLGAAVQRRGAKAVLATLWPVADESTAAVMQRFYQLRSPAAAANGTSVGNAANTSNANNAAADSASTATALRQAQLGLLTGQITLKPSQATLASRGDAAASAAVANTPDEFRARPYQHDRDKPFAHPYYWAPFILMGNWL